MTKKDQRKGPRHGKSGKQTTMESSLGWQVAECFLVDESTSSSIDSPVGMTNEVNFDSNDSAMCITGTQHCKSLQDSAEFLTAPKKRKEAHQRVSHQLDLGRGG